MKLREMDRLNGISREDLREEVWEPKHYTVGGYEAIDVIRAKLSPEEYRGWCKGNVLKYIMRANYKNHHDQDCEKSQFYMQELINGLDSRVPTSPTHWEDEEQVREENSRLPPF